MFWIGLLIGSCFGLLASALCVVSKDADEHINFETRTNMSEDRCLYCNDVIPEGRMVCPRCEKDLTKSGKQTMLVKLDSGAYVPTRAHSTDAGIDLKAKEDQVIPARESAIFHTGVHVKLPRGTAGVLVSKSGLNVKHDITSTGLIDEGYDGEIVVKLYNNGSYDYQVKAGDKISQLVVVPVLYEDIEITDDLQQNSERGSDGFGSTGK